RGKIVARRGTTRSVDRTAGETDRTDSPRPAARRDRLADQGRAELSGVAGGAAAGRCAERAAPSQCRLQISCRAGREQRSPGESRFAARASLAADLLGARQL